MSVRLGLVGAGLVGKRHAGAIALAAEADLVAVADPSDDGALVAKEHGAAHFGDFTKMISEGQIDGLVIATPNNLHAAQAMLAIEAEIPALVEKPFTANVADGEAVVEAAARHGVPLMTGHHRRHNPVVAKAVALIRSGALGQLVSVQSSTWLKKPDDYFEPDWRRAEGGGPVLVNLIHDVDLLRYFCGDVTSLCAMSSNAVRGFAVEESSVAMLRFANGVLGTMTLSDTIPAPISWELTARENPAYPATAQDCYWIGGTLGTLALPSLTLWQHEADRGWWAPISATRHPVGAIDPLVAQITQFADVIEGRAKPLVSGEDGLEALRIVDAIHRSARDGVPVTLSSTKPEQSA